MRAALALIPLMMLAGCGGGADDGNVQNVAAASIPLRTKLRNSKLTRPERT